MTQSVATITSKGQITLPADIRRRLGVGPKDKVVFVVDDDGEIRVKKAQYSTIESIVGIAGSIESSLSWDEMLEIAHDDVAERYRKQHLGEK